jgi:hypothetical protein
MTSHELLRELRTVLAQPQGGQPCACGCGRKTRFNASRYVPGHNLRKYSDDYIEGEGGCWIWQRALLKNGYGAIKRDGYRGVAHRWYYERYVGPIPAGLEIDHLCRKRACVNPAHLEPVTREENIRRGAATRLTQVQADEILASAGTYAEIGKRFGVTATHVGQIKNARSWANGRTRLRPGHRRLLTDRQVAEIRNLVSNGMMQKEVASRFGVTASYVSHIMAGRAR